ncbi:hypothetical protein [Shewanella algae]|uniref:hypothetical protein n=1 Tax=Shewanella algae TaxID=38313 RepID=UPI0031F5D8B1
MQDPRLCQETWPGQVLPLPAGGQVPLVALLQLLVLLRRALQQIPLLQRRPLVPQVLELEQQQRQVISVPEFGALAQEASLEGLLVVLLLVWPGALQAELPEARPAVQELWQPVKLPLSMRWAEPLPLVLLVLPWLEVQGRPVQQGLLVARQQAAGYLVDYLQVRPCSGVQVSTPVHS